MKRIFIAIVLFPYMLFSQGWEMKNTGVPTADLYDISFSSASPNHGLAVGSNGTVLYTTNGGNSWVQGTSGTTYGIYEVVDVNGTIGYAVGQNRLVIKTTDGGVTWSYLLPTITNQHAQGVCFLDANIGYFVGTNGTMSVIYKTTNGGSAWSGPINPIPDWQLNAVNFSNYDYGISVGNNGVIHRTTNGGLDWISATSGVTDQLNDVIYITSNVVIAVGQNGKIIRSTDAGSSWSTISSGTTINLRGVGFTSATEGYIIGYSGLILKTTDAGLSWQSQTSPTTNNIWGVMFYTSNMTLSSRLNSGEKQDKAFQKATSTTIGFAAGYSGTIIKYSASSSSNWKVYRQSDYLITGGNQVRGVGVTPTGNIWLAAEGSFAGVSKYNGTSWNPLSKTSIGIGANSKLNDLKLDQSSNPWLGATGYSTGTNLANFDGSSWLPLTHSFISNYGVSHIGIDNQGNKWFASGMSVVLYNAAKNWIQYLSNTYFSNHWVMCLAAYNYSNNVWIGTSDGGAYVWNGSAWNHLPNVPFTYQVVNAIAAEPGGNVWAGAENEPYIARYTGTSWQKFGPLPTGSTINCITIEGNGIPAFADKSIQKATGSNAIWIGTNNGLVKYDGVSFTSFTRANTNGEMPGTNIYAITIDGSGKKYIGTDSGLVVYTESQSSTNPNISFNPSSLSFGENNIGTNPTLNLTVSNTGSANLTLTSTRITGSDSASYSIISQIPSPAAPITIAPGSTFNIVVRFSPGTPGLKSATLNISHNASGSPSLIALTGTGKGTPSISWNPSNLQFGNLNIGTSSNQQLTISNQGNDTLKIINAIIGGSDGNMFSITAGNIPANILPGGNLIVSLRFTPNSSGNKSASLQITHNASGSPASISLSGTGVSLAPAISIIPASINFGQVNTGSSKDENLTITNTGNDVLTIAGFSVSGSDQNMFSRFSSPDSSSLAISISPGSSYTIKIRFTPSAAGAKNANLKIQNNSSVQPDITLSGTGFDPNPVLTLDKNSISFDTVYAGEYLEKLLTISNSGASNLVLSGIITTTGDSLSFRRYSTPDSSSIQLNITPGNSYTLRIRFSPISEGNKNTVLRIFSNTGQPADVRLRGVCIQPVPVLTMEDVSVEFDTAGIAVGSFSDMTIKITNSGKGNLQIIKTVTSQNDSTMFSRFPIDSSNQVITILPSSSYTLTIRFSPISDGDKSTNFLIYHNASGVVKTISLKGKGVRFTPDIALNTTSINFGNASYSTSVDKYLTITNTGKAQLQIYSITKSGDSSAFRRYSNPDSSKIQINISSGNSYTITIKFTALQLGILSAQFQLKHNASSGMSFVDLSGRGLTSQITFKKDSIDFGYVKYNVDQDTTIVFTNTGEGDLYLGNINLSGDVSSFRITQNPNKNIIGPGISDSLKVRFSAVQNDIGISKNAKIHISTNIYQRSLVEYPITGKKVAPEIDYPAELSFGKLKVDSSMDYSFLFSNKGLWPLQISSMKIEGSNADEFLINIAPFPITIQPGKSAFIPIKFSPKTTGMKNASVRILSDDPKNNNITINFTAEGIKQNLTSNLSMIDFGKVSIAKIMDTVIIVQNQGTEVITIYTGSLTGKDSLSYVLPDLAPGTSIRLNPGESKSIKIRFKPSTGGIKNAALELRSSDVLNPTLVVNLSGNSVNPKISSRPTTLDFGNLRVNTYWIFPVFITNTGEGILKINNVRLSGTNADEFKINYSPLNKELVSGSKDSIVIQFEPKSIGDKNAFLITESNDPDKQFDTVKLTGKSKSPKLTISIASLNFGRVLLQMATDTVFKITNEGTDALIIKRIYVLSGDTIKIVVKDDISNLSLLPSESKTISLQFQPLKEGIRSSKIIIESDDPNSKSIELSFSGEGILPQITSENSSIAFFNQDMPIAFSMENIVVPTDVRVFYKKGGALKYDSSINLSPQNTNAILGGKADLKYSYNLSKANITKRGIDYYIQVKWNNGVITTYPKDFFGKPMALQISFGNEPLSPDYELYPKEYYIFNIPALISGSNIFNEMRNNLGDVNNTVWRIFRRTSSDYLEVIDERSSLMNPAEAFWLISKNWHQISIKNCLTVPTNAPYIHKIGPGWNLIGNPFMFPTPAASLNLPAGKNIEKYLWSWELDNSYLLEETMLRPWKGYFIKNLERDSVEISFSPILYNGALAKNQSSLKLREKEWYISADIKIGENVIKDIRFGCLNNSSNQWDINDASLPPQAPEQSVMAFFPHKDWYYPDNYVHDYRQISLEGWIWNMDINNLNKENTGELILQPKGNLPKGYFLSINNIDNSSLIYKNNFDNLRDVKISLPITFSNARKQLKFIVGNSDFINNKENTTPVNGYSLSQNYPNPFNPGTNIEFSISLPGYTKLAIYNLLGKEVTNIVDKFLPAGNYRYYWNAISLPSGVYYYTLQSGKFFETKKLILMK